MCVIFHVNRQSHLLDLYGMICRNNTVVRAMLFIFTICVVFAFVFWGDFVCLFGFCLFILMIVKIIDLNFTYLLLYIIFAK